MTRNPVALTAEDDCAVASAAIREYRLKSLPVVAGKNDRKLMGCIRARRLMAYVFKQIDPLKDGGTREVLATNPPRNLEEPARTE